MKPTLHLTSGDTAGDLLEASGIDGEVFVWRDVLYDGPRISGWPTSETLETRAQFLSEFSDGGLSPTGVLGTLERQYEKLASTGEHDGIVLWFDACLFDQSMLAHVLTCLALKGIQSVDLLCVDAFPGIEPFNGLGQLKPEQLAPLLNHRRPVTEAQFAYARSVDRAFALQDQDQFQTLAAQANAPLPWVPAAVRRWLLETPDPETGLGRLESLALAAIRNGNRDPMTIFRATAAAETPPQYWGDTTLWARINALAERHPPLVAIEGPASRLPVWDATNLDAFRVSAIEPA